MVTKHEIIKALNKIAPESSAEPWDNCGMQLDLGKNAFEKIIVCLEITGDVIEEAKAKGADLIITHHPLYFRETKNIINGTFPGEYTIELIKSGISVYSAHTSFDKADGGNNTELCEMLGLTDIEKMYESGDVNDYVGYMGLVSDAKPPTLEELALRVKSVLHLEKGEVRMTGAQSSIIYKVGVCTGAGADLMQLASSYGCDAFVTGDVKYHEAQLAKELGIGLIDAGHYGTEAIFAPNMADKLRGILGAEADIEVSETDINPFTIV